MIVTGYCGKLSAMHVPCGIAASNVILPPNTSHTLNANGIPKPVPKRLVLGPGLRVCGSGVNGMPVPSSLRRQVNVVSTSCVAMKILPQLGEASMAFKIKL